MSTKSSQESSSPSPYRLKVSLSRETSQKLNLMRAEASKQLGRSVTKSEIVSMILEQFFSTVRDK